MGTIGRCGLDRIRAGAGASGDDRSAHRPPVAARVTVPHRPPAAARLRAPRRAAHRAPCRPPAARRAAARAPRRLRAAARPPARRRAAPARRPPLLTPRLVAGAGTSGWTASAILDRRRGRLKRRWLPRRRFPAPAASYQYQDDGDTGDDRDTGDRSAGDGAPVVDGAGRVHLFRAGLSQFPDQRIPADFIGVVVLDRPWKSHPVLDREHVAQHAAREPCGRFGSGRHRPRVRGRGEARLRREEALVLGQCELISVDDSGEESSREDLLEFLGAGERASEAEPAGA